MAAATASASATGASYLHNSSGSDLRRLRPPKKVSGCTKFSIHFPNCSSSTRLKGYFPIRALDPKRGVEKEEEENSSITNNSRTSNSQDDLEYLGKLVAGSIAGAALIKYGSIVFPEITRPNLIQALIIVLTPVIVAVLLLLQQSHAEGRR